MAATCASTWAGVNVGVGAGAGAAGAGVGGAGGAGGIKPGFAWTTALKALVAA